MRESETVESKKSLAELSEGLVSIPYILRNIRIGMRLEGFTRVDVPEIPTAALREAIINAFCHRDYRDHDEVRVAIFPNRVEIRNPGSLPEGYSIDDLRSKQISRRRNPIIASLLQRIHLIEAWGRGLTLILANAPNATFEQVGPILITTFPRNPQPESGVESGVESQLESEMGSGLKARIVLALRGTPFGKKTLSDHLGQRVVSGPLHQAIRELVAERWIEPTLPDKPQSRLQRYQLTAKARARLAARP